jgi:hypothetical protein
MFVSTMLVCDYISGQDLSQLLLEHIRESVLLDKLYMVLKRKTKKT